MNTHTPNITVFSPNRIKRIMGRHHWVEFLTTSKPFRLLPYPHQRKLSAKMRRVIELTCLGYTGANTVLWYGQCVCVHKIVCIALLNQRYWTMAVHSLPPLLATLKENLHTLPRPTANPTRVKTNWKRLSHTSRFFFFFPPPSPSFPSPPSSSSPPASSSSAASAAFSSNEKENF